MTHDGEAAARAGLCLTGLLSVSALLAWCFGFGPFSTWFLALSVPSTLLLAGVGWWLRATTTHQKLRISLLAGAAGGLLGTIGYDVFRLPFVASGLRVLAPIDSYGVLALGSAHSSGWTGLAGWLYHFANGIGFGIAYAMVARGRHWGWAIGWAMVLETATVLTPFYTRYGLNQHHELVAIAYAAHVFYGLPLGIVVQRSASWESKAPLAIPVSAQLLVLVVALTSWQHPWSVPGPVRDTAGPAVSVVKGRFSPEWVRVSTRGCFVIVNTDPTTYTLPVSKRVLAPGQRVTVCKQKAGVRRLKLTSAAYSGGFVIWDPEA